MWNANRRPVYWRRAALVATMLAATVAGANDGAAPMVVQGAWVPTASLAHARWHHTATLLMDGRVLVAGGDADCCYKALASAEIYNPATGMWSPTGAMKVPRSYHTATLLPDGKVLVVGGVDRTRNSLK